MTPKPLRTALLAPLIVTVLATGCTSAQNTAGPASGEAHPESRTAGRTDAARPTTGAQPGAPDTRAPDGRTTRDPEHPVPPTRAPQGPPTTNPRTDTRTDNRSTFALDVDTAAWTRARSQLGNGTRPNPHEVRTEEFVNAFDQGYRAPQDGLGVHLDGAAVPALESPATRVVRVGVQAAESDPRTRPPAHLTFVVDISGSMAAPGRLDLVKTSLHQLVGALRPDDSVSVVVYSDRTRVVLPPTSAGQREAILGVVDDLRTEGSTNVEAGLSLGYQEALRNQRRGGLNRVVLLSDGVANVGNTGPDPILDTIGRAAQQQVDLVTVGFGMGSYNDRLMEQLADKGNGFHAYVDDEIEARRLFVQRLSSTLVVTARDAKAQVEFDPQQVESYRLLGYENRAVADEDFRNDRVDGGEVGAGHSVTALYEITLRPGGLPVRPLATATVRYLHPDTREPIERRAELMGWQFANSPENAAPHLQLAVASATLAESLRGTGWGARRTPAEVANDCERAAARVGDQPARELALTARRAVR
ncbi:DUF3520 domain-containing protein [Naumannella sp. ID2617S]|nr:DUF3520 domain-containing protein [Naumannella sp. ID2617S]